MIRTVPAVAGVVVLGESKPTIKAIKSGKATILIVSKAA
jgi:ribosomal protein L30E